MTKKNLYIKPRILEVIKIFLGMLTVTAISYLINDYTGLASVSFLYLTLIVWVSYKNQVSASVFVAVGSFLLINFFYVEPRYTFAVGSAESWSALLGFLLVSTAITSLVHQLKNQQKISEKATFKANLLRGIIEIFSMETELITALKKSCFLLKSELHCDVSILMLDHISNTSTQLASSKSDDVRIEFQIISHAIEYGAMLGPNTGTLENLNYWCIPLGRYYKSYDLPALVIERNQEENIEVELIRVIADQLSVHYQKRVAELNVKVAQELAHRESIQTAFLSSISHDMRTPLTTIIGASSSLLKQGDQLGALQSETLLQLIHTEAMYLNDSTENILSLVKLGMSSDKEFWMDWQSPEEIIGTVLSRYKNRELKTQIIPKISTGDALIYGDQSLIVLALINLIENAIQAHQGSNPIQVIVDKFGDEIRIGVIDEGRGFPAGFDINLAGLQQAYQRSKKGFGLGLSIVRAVMDKHLGRLIIEATFEGNRKTYVGMCFPLKANI